MDAAASVICPKNCESYSTFHTRRSAGSGANNGGTFGAPKQSRSNPNKAVDRMPIREMRRISGCGFSR